MPSALRASRPFSRPEAELFVCFFRYRARLPPPRPGRACLCGGLLEGSCGRRKRRNMLTPAKSRHVCPLTTAVSKRENAIISFVRRRRKVWIGRVAKRGPAGSRLLLHANREGPPRAGEEGVLDAGRIRLVSEKLQAFYVRGNHGGNHGREMSTFFPPDRQRTREFICFMKAFM